MSLAERREIEKFIISSEVVTPSRWGGLGQAQKLGPNNPGTSPGSSTFLLLTLEHITELSGLRRLIHEVGLVTLISQTIYGIK